MIYRVGSAFFSSLVEQHGKLALLIDHLRTTELRPIRYKASIAAGRVRIGARTTAQLTFTPAAFIRRRPTRRLGRTNDQGLCFCIVVAFVN